MNKVILTVALNGSLPTKEMNPNVPITPEELGVAAAKCQKPARVSPMFMLAMPMGSPLSILKSSRIFTARSPSAPTSSSRFQLELARERTPKRVPSRFGVSDRIWRR